MLAQLEALPGVDEARVDWTGEHFLLLLGEQADPGDVERRVARVLGAAPARLEGAARAEKVASFRRGEAWMRSGETLRLSDEEARVLAVRTGDAIAGEMGLDGVKADALRELLREEIFRAFQRIHAAAGGLEERLERDAPVVLERIGAGCRRFLADDESEQVLAALRRRFGRSP
ncbi:MAG TPA: hypothetical protein VFS92_11000 [Planctomycetota bacterium]|nr:hypothetical protein [Planctomycetota bacterium]